MKGMDDMWATYDTRVQVGGSLVFRNLVIHIHSPLDINPAGWNHGKFGAGQSESLE